MSIPNEREIKNSEVRQESYTDINGNTHTHVTRTAETLNNAANPSSYQKGYVQGRNSELRYQQANLAERDDANTSNGLLMGIIITSLAGLIIGGVWYFNQVNNAAVENSAPVTTPTPSNSSATPTEPPQPQTTIIERTKEVAVPVPVPQQVVPSSAPRQPNINITVPPQQPRIEIAPSVTQPAPNKTQGQTTSPSTNTPTSQKNSSTEPVTPGSESDTSKTTPQGADQSNTTSNSDSSKAGGRTTDSSSQ
ncbi:MAG: hypothetical protein RMX96_14165 [Nostoc sp. ChiSLP02]|nr:hypothetical protein [Nostoc sp. DedSLP05]MDZ8099760.1 hypothetical protein [Nostoc sp. DedSLP01]MDZ8185983.1 hypothetical protein [Nostoc sp. ChiSLP02]